MASSITPQEREEMEAFLAAHPIDPAYDEECKYFDGEVPEEQLLARDFKKFLTKILFKIS